MQPLKTLSSELNGTHKNKNCNLDKVICISHFHSYWLTKKSQTHTHQNTTHLHTKPFTETLSKPLSHFHSQQKNKTNGTLQTHPNQNPSQTTIPTSPPPPTTAIHLHLPPLPLLLLPRRSRSRAPPPQTPPPHRTPALLPQPLPTTTDPTAPKTPTIPNPPKPQLPKTTRTRIGFIGQPPQPP